MTTIAYRDGVLAGDGQETFCALHESAMTLRDDCVKVFKLPDGRLFAGAHASEDIERLHQALIKNQAPPKLEDVSGLMIDRRRRVWHYEGNIWQRIKMPFFAIGSGAGFAMAAMLAGATAVEAVKIGIRLDPYSGGKVTALRLR